MSVSTNKSPAATKPVHDFRAAAVDLAAQLHVASRTAAELVFAAAQNERTIEILRNHMTPAQRIQAQLEIDALRAQADAALAQRAAAAA